MSETQTELVDIHSLNGSGDGVWELCVYQTPSVLTVKDSVIARRLNEALEHGRAVRLSWEPESGLVRGCS